MPTDLTAQGDCMDKAHDALNRMKRAFDRGTGCYLTAEMLASLNLTIVGDVWSQDDPRKAKDRTND